MATDEFRYGYDDFQAPRRHLKMDISYLELLIQSSGQRLVLKTRALFSFFLEVAWEATMRSSLMVIAWENVTKDLNKGVGRDGYRIRLYKNAIVSGAARATVSRFTLDGVDIGRD